MNKLKELINKLCPNGVEHKKLGELIIIEKGKQLNKTLLSSNGKYPVINGGIMPSGYWNEYNYTENLITISQGGASAGYVNFIDTKFWAGAHCYVIVKVDSKINYRYVYHFLKSKENELQNSQVGAGIPSVSLKDINNLYIAVPPLEIQCEIVHILDDFTELSAELSAELKARKKQYEYYNKLLLSFDNGIPVVKLRDIIDFKNGKGHENVVEKNGKYILVTSKAISTDMRNVRKTDRNLVPLYYEDIVMVMSDLPNGKALAKCFLVDEDEKYTLNQRIGCFTNKREDIINTKFLYYILNRNSQLLKYDNGVEQTNLRKDDILNIDIPIPKKEQQIEIIKVLDKFDKLCNDISEGLPAEIEARQKQYEYYRDKLLTFKELKVNE